MLWKKARPIVFFWEKELVTLVKLMTKFLFYFWYAPKRHTICGIHGKLQIGFSKMADFRAKIDECQGKNLWLRSKMSAHLRILIFLDHIEYSLRKVTMKSMRRYIYEHSYFNSTAPGNILTWYGQNNLYETFRCFRCM